jgi:hypothetical protein
VSYDKNGNITTLQRNGLNSSTAQLIDNLSYNYSGNRLNYVNDAVAGNQDVGDFRNNNTGTDDYTYWNDGSLKSDKNKGISQIEYDSFLRKVKLISFTNGNWIKFFYDGAGTLLKRSNSNGNYWDYVGNMIYKNGQPYQMSIPEGRAVWNGTDWEYEFEYRDHLGNMRLGFKAEGNQLVKTQSNTPDPLGLDIKSLNIVGAKPQNFQFNKIEKIDDFGINIHHAFFRDGDSQIGRWWQIDPKPNVSVSLYSMMDNNAVRFMDMLGDTTVVNRRGRILSQYGGENIIYQQGRNGKLTKIGEFGKSVNINGIMGNILQHNKTIAKTLGLKGFFDHVKTGGEWDYKGNKSTIFGAVWKYDENKKNTTKFTYKEYKFNDAADIGNYHAGFMGRFTKNGEGFAPETLWFGAGAAQIAKDVTNLSFKEAFKEIGSFIKPIIPYGDQMDDFIWNTTGMIDANTDKKQQK